MDDRSAERVAESTAAVPGGERTDLTRAALPWWALVLACVVWLGLWYFTPGLHGNGVGYLFTADDDVSLLIETALALLMAVVLVLLHPRYNRVLFARSTVVVLYSLPAALAIALPVHYEMPVPVLLYISWMTVSVFWQDYLTFGLLQSYLNERLPTWAVVSLVAVIFYLGHAVFIPDRFAPVHVVPALGILALGGVLALLRARLKTLHLILVLHLSFYFIFA